jgi:transcriptional regulator with XRE-family HTH domain
MQKSDEEVQRVSEALREAIRRRKTSQRQIERVLGQGKGYLSQLLGGNVDLKLKHVFAVLEVLGLEADEFFLGIYGRSDPVGAVRGMVAQSQAHRELEELKNRVARLEKKVGLDPEQKSKLWP